MQDVPGNEPCLLSGSSLDTPSARLEAARKADRLDVWTCLMMLLDKKTGQQQFLNCIDAIRNINPPTTTSRPFEELNKTKEKWMKHYMGCMRLLLASDANDAAASKLMKHVFPHDQNVLIDRNDHCVAAYMFMATPSWVARENIQPSVLISVRDHLAKVIRIMYTSRSSDIPNVELFYQKMNELGRPARKPWIYLALC